MKVFVVEDDKWYADFLNYHLSMNPDYEIETFGSGEEVLKELYRGPDVITIDYSLPDMDGDKLFREIRKKTDVPVIIISGQQDLATAIGLLKEGIYDYIIKDDDAKERLWTVMRNIKENFELKGEVQELRLELKKSFDFSSILKGESIALNKVFSLIEKASKANITVSVTGETGTGKELVARAIHYNSSRANNQLVAVNVAAIPKELLESELFGHEKGAFTGAQNKRIGKFEEANKGTIFLDEIGELDLNLQAKLLRVLQEREIVRIGGNKPIKLDVRLIVATHRDLGEQVRNGNFREDLYYRIQGLPIHLPPLRERDNDIIVLADYFLAEFVKENGMGEKSFSKQAKSKLMEYAFPGNIRELKSVVELSALLSDEDVIETQDIKFNAVDRIESLVSSEMTMYEFKVKIIKHFLDKYDNIQVVAEKLDIGVSTIYRILQQEQNA